MRKLILGFVFILFLLVIFAVLVGIPTELTGVQKYAAIFLGILVGAASIAEIVGLINYFSISKPQEPFGDSIKTKGKYSPGKVLGNYQIAPKNTFEKKADASSEASVSNQGDLPKNQIQTEGDYSPGVVEGNYEVTDEQK